MTFADLLTFNYVNVDRLTETYTLTFYGEYLVRWSEFQRVIYHPTGLIMGYHLGKAEGEKELWHGHVSAVTIAPAFRRLGLGAGLMKGCEATTSELHRANFVDLFVRKSNKVAVEMYKKLGYVIYRTVTGYYSERQKGKSEDAYDMRKPMPADVDRRSIIPLKNPVITPDELEFH